MEDKKMPFAVFVLKWIENKVRQYKTNGEDEFDFIDNLIYDCTLCPLYDKCNRGASECKTTLKEYVESAE